MTYGPCCACTRVILSPLTDVETGLKSDRWVCSDCGREFVTAHRCGLLRTALSESEAARRAAEREIETQRDQFEHDMDVLRTRLVETHEGSSANRLEGELRDARDEAGILRAERDAAQAARGAAERERDEIKASNDRLRAACAPLVREYDDIAFNAGARRVDDLISLELDADLIRPIAVVLRGKR